MNLVLIGLNYRTAPVTVRERYAVPARAVSALNEKLVHGLDIAEAALISTCNRTELLAVSSGAEAVREPLQDFFQSQLGDGSARGEQLYELREGDAVLHVLRVAASLDSMVLGEAQILGQLKQAYRAAMEARSLGPVLHRLFQRAFGAAKRVRTETGLGASTVSLARVGVHLARELFESLRRKRVLLLGAGEMAESALRGLCDAGAGEVVVLSRTREAAVRLAERLGGRPGSLEELPRELVAADVIVSSLQTLEPVLLPFDLLHAAAARHGRPLLVVDLGIPRNVACEVNELENVYLYNLDDLEHVAERGREDRKATVETAERIVQREHERFERWRASLPLAPTIRLLTEHARQLARGEARRLSGQLQNPTADPQVTLERLAEGIVAKLLHQPLRRLRAESERGASLYYADSVRQLFGLEDEDEE